MNPYIHSNQPYLKYKFIYVHSGFIYVFISSRFTDLKMLSFIETAPVGQQNMNSDLNAPQEQFRHILSLVWCGTILGWSHLSSLITKLQETFRNSQNKPENGSSVCMKTLSLPEILDRHIVRSCLIKCLIYSAQKKKNMHFSSDK